MNLNDEMFVLRDGILLGVDRMVFEVVLQERMSTHEELCYCLYIRLRLMVSYDSNLSPKEPHVMFCVAITPLTALCRCFIHLFLPNESNIGEDVRGPVRCVDGSSLQRDRQNI